MKVATFRDAKGVRLGVVRDDQKRLIDLAHVAHAQGETHLDELLDMSILIERGQAARQRLDRLVRVAQSADEIDLRAVELLAPIPRPRKNIFGVGSNYLDYALNYSYASRRETGIGRIQQYPIIFTKAVTSVTGPYSNIPFDASISDKLDWEIELGVIIGAGGRRIPKDDALNHVWGYTIINDMSARDIQYIPDNQWFLGKSIDGTCPIGPWIVTADEIGDPQDLTMRLTVNGVEKQSGSTKFMLFSVADLISTMSVLLTFDPGDIISTGSISGVGWRLQSPEYLKPGDEMVSTIEKIGVMRNRIVDVQRRNKP